MAAVMTHKMAAVARNHGKFARAEIHVLVAQFREMQTKTAKGFESKREEILGKYFLNPNILQSEQRPGTN